MTTPLIHIAYVRSDGLSYYLCGAPSTPIRYRNTGKSRLRPIATTSITCPDCLAMKALEGSLEPQAIKRPTTTK